MLRPETENLANINKWWQTNFPNQTLFGIKKFAGGQSNNCYLLNSSLVLKMYSPKFAYAIGGQSKHFEVGSHYQQLLSQTGFAPKIFAIYKNDPLLGTNAILMEYVDGKDLSQVIYTYSEEQKYQTGREIGKLLRSFHSAEIIPNQKYDTQVLINQTKEEYEGAKTKGLIYPELADSVESMINNYEPRIIVDNFVLTHGDAHLENFIVTKTGLRVIDLDTCSLDLPIHDMRMLLHTACMPINIVAVELEKFYSSGSLISMLKGVINEYPQVCPSKYIAEIKLIALLEILNKFNLPNSLVDKDTPRIRAMEMFNIVFEENLLESILK